MIDNLKENKIEKLKKQIDHLKVVKKEKQRNLPNYIKDRVEVNKYLRYTYAIYLTRTSSPTIVSTVAKGLDESVKQVCYLLNKEQVSDLYSIKLKDLRKIGNKK